MAGGADVIVVGAGVAGLAAAGVLTRAGRRVEILEARPRIGGRIYTVCDPMLAVPVELGAEFIHGRPREIWDIIDRSPVLAYDVGGGRRCYWEGRLAPCDDLFEKTGPVFEKMAGAADEPFEQFLARCDCGDDAKAWAAAYVEGFDAARKERVSAAALAFEEKAAEGIQGDRLFRVLGGYDTIVSWLYDAMVADRAVVHLNTAVEALDWAEGRVTARTSREEAISARCAVITAPLGVLQAGAIRFHPEPVDVLEAARNLEFGKVIRLTLRFRERFWEENELLDDLGFLHSLETPFPTWWTLMPLRTPVLTAWSAGPHAEALAGMNRSALCGKAIDVLGRMLGIKQSRLSGLVEASYVHDWQADPCARGAYSYVPAGAQHAREQLSCPVADTLWFAGEAANTEGHPATVHGAIASGQRAARSILERARLISDH